MRLLHISDLHIGKRIYECSMLEDQRFTLDKILDIVKEIHPDGVMIAGDIYDKAVPSAEAVREFDRFLTALADFGTPVFAVSGNHDSPERIAFGAELMSGRQVYVSPVYDGTVRRVALEDEWGEAYIYLLPYVKLAHVRHALHRGEENDGEEDIVTLQDALEAVVGRMEIDRTKRNVLIAHQYVTGASRCESEEMHVGGLDQVSAEVFSEFDYVALGHLHSPQHVGRETVRYCGTPLKYSFSEADQEKSVTVVELEEKGRVLVRTIPLVPKRDMRKIRGTYLELTSLAFYRDMDTNAYIQATLTDEEDVPDCIRKLRVIYPNLLSLEYDNKRTRENREIAVGKAVEQKSELELFEDFYKLQNNQPMSAKQREFAGRLIGKLRGM